MKEYFSISPHPRGRGFEMTLSNGSVDVPDERGAYVISTGCGSGKTECAKSIIRQKASSGVLYCVDTRTELAKMYNWILEELCTPRGPLTKDDVLMLTSDKVDDFEAMLKTYQDHPEIVTTKKVLLLTHARFWTDLIDYFLIFSPKKPSVSTFTRDFAALMKRTDLRGYIIFDETPTFIKPFVSIPKPLLGSFCNITDGKISPKTPQEMTDIYNKFIKGSALDFYKSKCKLKRDKVEAVMGMLPNALSDMKSNQESLEISFTPTMLCQEGMKTHVLILEGAGDILFRGSKRYKILDVPTKYNAHVGIEQFEFPLAGKRYEDIDPKDYDSYISWLAARIKRTEYTTHEKTLVVVWKNQGIKAKGMNGHDLDGTESEYVERVKNSLITRDVPEDMFSVTYYGAKDTKSTNNYRDYKEIILCGSWHLPETYKFRRDFSTATSEDEHLMWYYIQLVCRIGIRKHDGLSYRVVFSVDHG